jgi:hypothetical protein
MKEVTMTRHDLYDLVWKESMLALSKKYVISGTGLKKKCKALEIPVPVMGYWAKLQFGKTGNCKTPLPKFDGDQTVTLYLREESDPTNERRIELIKQLEEDKSLNVTIPDKLVNPDKLIVAAKDDIFKRKVWNKNDEIVYSSSGYLSISVSPKNLHRALIFLDTLIKVLKQRGHSITIEQNTTYFIIEGEKIPICCREKYARVLVKGTYSDSFDNKPTGLLSLKVDESYSTKEWTEGKKTIEQLLPKIIINLDLLGKKLKEERIERERYWAEQKEKDRIAKEFYDRKEKELKNFLEILKNAKRHDNSQKIRKYADELERFSIENGSLSDNMKEKITWIRKKADWFDPFIEAEDEWMQGIDRDELKIEKKIFPWLSK